MLMQQRLSDLLSDDRTGNDGLIHFLRKSSIARVVELKQDIEQEMISDPYDILGLPRHVSDEELLRS